MMISRGGYKEEFKKCFLGDRGVALSSPRPPLIASFDSEVTDDDDDLDRTELN